MAVSTPLEIRLHNTLRRIAKVYMKPAQIRRDADHPDSALDYEEYLEMAYENIQLEAARAIKGVRIRRPFQGPTP